jgi:hypothetical protein
MYCDADKKPRKIRRKLRNLLKAIKRKKECHLNPLDVFKAIYNLADILPRDQKPLGSIVPKAPRDRT